MTELVSESALTVKHQPRTDDDGSTDVRDRSLRLAEDVKIRWSFATSSKILAEIGPKSATVAERENSPAIMPSCSNKVMEPS